MNMQVNPGSHTFGAQGADQPAPVRVDLQRAFDVVVAAVAIVFLLPLMALTALAVALSSDGPILFRHQRVGRHGRTFFCLKFRTMAVDATERLASHLASDVAAAAEWAHCHKLKQDPRVTPFGAILRASSLDELPQLFNVLRGEMSLVGPRPITAGEMGRYGDSLYDYLSVRPGMTGLWQVRGRSSVGYAERVEMDVQYVRERSLLLNLQILALTVPAVLRRRGSC